MAPVSPSDSRYHLIAELDRGGMANVFLCLTRGIAGTRKLHVLKCLKEELRQEPFLVEMFLDEGRLATRLNHPNVVQTFDVGVGAHGHFIAMEYLEGQSLAKTLRAHARTHGRPLPRAVHLRILCAAMRGLDYAHDLRDFDGTPLNVVHRDVSPQNVFLTYAGTVKLIDFGIAKATMMTNTTEAGTMKGKASYVAPEQALGAPIDRRVDVFAMGMLLWAAAVGRPMWQNESDVQRLTDILTGKLRMPRDVAPDVPAELDAIVSRALQRLPEDRWPSILELRGAVEAYLATSEPPGTLGEREAILAELFAKRRAEVEEAIRSRVARISAPSAPLRASQPPRSLLALEEPPSEVSFLDGAPASDREPEPALAPSAPLPLRPSLGPPRRPPMASERPTVTGITPVASAPPVVRRVERAVAAAIVVLGVVFSVQRFTRSAAPPSSSASPAAAATPTAPSSAALTPEGVEVEAPSPPLPPPAPSPSVAAPVFAPLPAPAPRIVEAGAPPTAPRTASLVVPPPPAAPRRPAAGPARTSEFDAEREIRLSR